MKEIIIFWVHFLATHNWQELVKDIEPKKTDSGIVVYELPLLNRLDQEFAIVDMHNIKICDPHYHANGETEIYFVLQGTAIVVVGKKEYHVQKGDVVVTPPYTTHFIITLSNDFVIAEVNTPSFNIGNYVPISESDDTFGFDKAQFERLIHAHYK